jgi:hypothetical protein
VKKIEDFEENTQIAQLKAKIQCSYVVLCSVCSEKNIRKECNNYITEKYTTTYNTYTTLHTQTTLNALNLSDMFNRIDELGIHGRNLELLFPILITAQMIGEEVFEDMLRIGAELIRKKKEDEYGDSKDVSLIEFIAEHGKIEWQSIKDLTAHFRLYVGDTGNEELWVNDKWLGRALKRLNLIKEKRRVASGNMIIPDIDKAKTKLQMFKDEKKTTN